MGSVQRLETGTLAEEEALRTRFAVREERFEHGDFRVDLLLPHSSEALIDVSDFNLDERLPYWAELWPSAKALARAILDADVVPVPVLELGCGVGLPSLVAARRGCEVLATDYYEDALHFCRANSARNGIAGIATRTVDWRCPPADVHPHPLILATDVLYEARNVEPLAATVAQWTAAGGEAWIADPGRTHAGSFLQRMRAMGWTVTESQHREVNADHPDRITPITIYRLRPPR